MANILVVEDDKYTNDVITNFLKADGHAVRSVTNGKGALLNFDKTIDAVVLDIMLPDISGIEILDTIRTENEDVIIVILSAITDEVTQLASFEKKVDEYIEKPFSPALLVKRINTLISRIGINTCENIIEVNGYRFDFDRFVVLKGKDRIHMTVKEMEIVRLLYNNQGGVLTRQQILNGVWCGENDVIDRTVDVHIKNIRKKTFTDIIETVKGIGYRLNHED